MELLVKRKKSLLTLYILCLLWPVFVYSQCSRALYPSGAQGNRAYLVCTTNPGANDDSWPYLTMGAHYVYAEVGEVICSGFSARSSGDTGGRIRYTSPTGVTHITGTGTVDVSGSGNSLGGLINNRAQELAGPYYSGTQGNRFTPFTVTVGSGQAGVWKVEFLPRGTSTDISSDPANVGSISANASWSQTNQPGPDNGSRAFIAAWDIAVWNPTSSSWKPGRVYANVLNLLLRDEWEASESFYATMYVMTKDGIAYRIKYQGNQGAGWTFFTNNKGFIGEDGYASYKSKNFSNFDLLSPFLHDPTGPDDYVGNYITHKMFYEIPGSDLPDTTVNMVPIAGLGETWLKNPRLLPEMENLVFTGAEGTVGQSGSKGAYISFDSNVKGLYKITIPSEDPQNPFIVLTGPCDVGPNTVYWDGDDSNGDPVPAGTSITEVTTQLYGAEVHFPYIDMEINPTGIVIEQLDENFVVMPGMDKVYWDDTDITGGAPARTSNPQYNGNTGDGISSNTNGHKWGAYSTFVQTPSGGYEGVPNNDGFGNGDFGNTRSIDTWSYAPGEEDTAEIEIVIMATDLRVDSLTKIGGPNVVSVGDNLTYAAAIFNNGPSEATTISTSPATFMFYVPPGITIDPNAVSFHSSVNGATPIGIKTFDPLTGILRVSVDMPDQSGGTFHIPCSVTGGVPDENVNVWAGLVRPTDIADPDATNPDINIPLPTDAFQEAAGIYAHSSTLPLFTDPLSISIASTNNIKRHLLVEMYANVSVTKSVSPAGPHTIGQQVVFTITANNAGISKATLTQVSDLLSSRYTYVSHTVSTGTYTPASGVWNIGTMNVNASATMTITCTINANGGAQVNTAVIDADEYDPAPANNTASATTNAPVNADLQITKIGFMEDNDPGDNASFTITVKNNGPSDATNIQVLDDMSTRYNFSNHAYVLSTGTLSWGGTYDNNLTWNIPFLASGAVATLIFTVQINNQNGSWTNTATVTGSQTDPVPGNNSSSDAPDNSGTAVGLEVSKNVSNQTPNVGDNVTFTIIALRTSGSITNVGVTDILPSGYTYVSHTATGTTYTPSTGIWQVGNLNNTTQSRTLTIVAKVKAPTGTPDEYRNVAAITGLSEVDSSLLNNIDDAEVTPLQADLAVNKTVVPATIRAGNNVVFTVAVTNNGPNTAVGVTVNDLLPDGYTYVSHTASTGTYNTGTGIWTVGNMANAATQTLTLTAKVKKDGSLLNTATATSSATYDPNLANNTDLVSIVRKLAVVLTNPMIRSRVE